MTKDNVRERYRGCLVGLAVGDAVGTTLEFTPRNLVDPISDMVGGGPFDLEPGQWTDDTSMALCLAESLVQCGGFNPVDQMSRYCQWLSSGYMSSTGSCFDIGLTTSTALYDFLDSGEPFAGSTEPSSASNGSLMRLAPVVMFFCPDHAAAREYAALSSKTTHVAAESVQACEILAVLILRALEGASKSHLLEQIDGDWCSDAIAAIASHHYQDKLEAQIRGSTYAVECLEAALWCFQTTGSYRDAILRAANLGDDADTTAAICGQVAGAYYGYSSIPTEWRAKLAMHDEIIDLADRLLDT